jgi:hypothetical protein
MQIGEFKFGAAGKTCTCISSFRRRTPLYLGHGSNFKNGQRGRICTCDPSVPGRVCWLLHYALKRPGGSQRRDAETQNSNLGNGPAVRFKNWRSRRDLHPHSSRRQRVAFLFSYESKIGLPAALPVVRHGPPSLKLWRAAFARRHAAGEGWEALVMLQSSLPTVICDTGFTDRQPDHLPGIGSGGGNHTRLKKFMRLLSVH